MSMKMNLIKHGAEGELQMIGYIDAGNAGEVDKTLVDLTHQFESLVLDMEKLEPRTINVYIATLKQFRYYIQQQDWSRYEIPFRKYDRTLPCVPSIEQASEILTACNTTLETALVKFLFSTGVRISEACRKRSPA